MKWDAPKFNVELCVLKMFSYVGDGASLKDPAFKDAVVPTRSEHIETKDALMILRIEDDALADVFSWISTVDGARASRSACDVTDSCVFDLKELGAVEEERWCVRDMLTHHASCCEPPMSFGRVPDGLDCGAITPRINLYAIACRKNVGK